MANEKETKKSLSAQWEEAQKKAQAEFDKLSPEEQEKVLEGQRSLQRKWDSAPYY
jgi:hypothetical protein